MRAGTPDESSGPATATTGHVPGATAPAPGLRPGEGDTAEGPPTAYGNPGESSGPATATTGHVPGATGAVPGLRPGEGAMGEGLPHARGVTGGGHPPGGNTACSQPRVSRATVIPFSCHVRCVT